MCSHHKYTAGSLGCFNFFYLFFKICKKVHIAMPTTIFEPEEFYVADQAQKI